MEQNEGRTPTPKGYDENEKSAYLEGMRVARAEGGRRTTAEALFDMATSAFSGAGVTVMIIAWSHKLPLFGLALALAMAGVAVGNGYRLVRDLQEDPVPVVEATRELLMLTACLTVIAAALAPHPITTAICLLSIGAALINEVRIRFNRKGSDRQASKNQDQDEGG